MTHKKIEVETDGLAMPEIHVVNSEETAKDQEAEKASKKTEKKRGISFETLAIPEIHVK